MRVYGEILLAMNNSSNAVEQFDLSLQKAPGRSLSLLGKYKALKNLGESKKAAQIKEMLMANWKDADEQALLVGEVETNQGITHRPFGLLIFWFA
jgi:predicted Zn-dependent protease